MIPPGRERKERWWNLTLAKSESYHSHISHTADAEHYRNPLLWLFKEREPSGEHGQFILIL
jgi:hypothetical protein